MASTLSAGPRRPGTLGRAQQVIRTRWDHTPVGAARYSPLGYHLTVSHEHRFLWFRVAKVATRTILAHLEQHTTLALRQGTNVRYPRDELTDYLAFAFVRHPVDRLMSCWRNKVVDTNFFDFDPDTLQRMQRIEHFTAWVGEHDLGDLEHTDRHVLRQVRLVDATRVDRLGRLERFDQDFTDICSAIGIPTTQAVARNRSVGGGVTRADLSPAVVRTIQDLYRRDMDVFGYE